MHENEGQIPIRVDFQASKNQSFFVRYMRTTDFRQIPYDQDGTNNILLSSTSGSDDRAHSITFGHTWVINSKMVNSFRVLANDVYANKPGPKFFSPSDVGIKAYTEVPGYTRIIVNNGFNVGSGSFTSNLDTKIKSYGASDDFTLVKGSHQLSVGGHYLYGSSSTRSRRPGRSGRTSLRPRPPAMRSAISCSGRSRSIGRAPKTPSM